ncbi:hypothetical protein SNOG_01153 [Parastagonospora nodorum SN15]|uniref:Peroxidase n=1 Tax=Phaeosphaeria nodorum (strain SN15 / ATCC MYA-4574 / FGSC 10173) TaxID=321614 RepID=Q0V4B1_PHANO|nr:hypothetical protein SNOG_01153 [Parastagonospora nodorum SN15]EAT90802.1 hypothetical protein SNOG_01153 [Parastagonospora nodorum SN15]
MEDEIQFRYPHIQSEESSACLAWLNDMLTKTRVNKGQETCPPVWKEISTALTAQFLADGQCTDAARAAIRASFHDCFNGACDGSLILADECSRSENRGLERLCGNLGSLAQQKEVGVADLIQFAAAHAIKTCPGGPTVPVKIGRKDSDQANTQGILPGPRAESGDLIKLFASKGFSPIDLAALIGAHTTAKQRISDPAQAGASLDSTVGTWDNKYYSETKNGGAPFTLPADKSISQNPITAIPFGTFAISKGAWDFAFVAAMTKMSMLGVNGAGLVDCTSALPGGSRKREIRSSNLFDRLKW